MRANLTFACGLLLRVLACILLGTLLLALVYCIPEASMEENLRRSALETIRVEGIYPEITHAATSYLDNWTDAYMLGEAAYQTEGSPFVNAMQAYHYDFGEGIPTESLVRHFEEGGYEYISSYPQYWHGYHLFLRPLLTVLDYSGIRTLNGAVQTLLTLILALLLWRRGLRAYILPWLLCVGMLMPLALAKSLQYSSCFYLLTLGSIAVLLQKPEAAGRRFLVLFLYLGIATAYFDFLTYPTAVFGVPALFWLNSHGEQSPKAALRSFLLALLVWLAGYGLMWGGKIVVGGLITGADHLGEALSHVRHWMGGERLFTLGYVLYFNVRDFVYTPVSFLSFGLAAVLALRFLRRVPRERRPFMLVLRRVFPYVLVGLLPFAWYLFLFTPSGVHHFFTNKACVTAAFAGLSALTRLCEDNPIQA